MTHRRPTPARPRLEPLEVRSLLAVSTSPLAERLDAQFAVASGRYGMAVFDPANGRAYGAGDVNQVFGTSSTIKLGVLYALMRRVDADPAVSLTTTLNVGAQYGTNQGDTLTANSTRTLRSLAETMIDDSNNWATNRLMDYLGVGNINAEFAALGLTDTRIDRYNTGDGSPSMHGLGTNASGVGVSRDYRAGHDNESTPFEMATLLRRIHENNALLTAGSYTAYWNIMNLNPTGSLTREYADSVSNGPGNTWGTAMDLYSKAGSNTWTGDVGVFQDDPTIGDHFQRSEAGRLVLADGRAVFYAMFVDEATDGDLPFDAMGRAGFEVARELAPGVVTVTPDGGALDDGRVAVIRGTAGDDDIRVDSANSLQVALRLNGRLLRSLTSSVFAPLRAVTAYGGAGGDRFTVAAGFAPQSTGSVNLVGGVGDDTFDVTASATTPITADGGPLTNDLLLYRGAGTLTPGTPLSTINAPGVFPVSFTGIERAFAPPTITAPADQSIPFDGAFDPLDFTVADAESPPEALVVSASSSNPDLLPDAAITLGGTGANRTIALAPVAGQSGFATITLRVVDETGQVATTTFQVEVQAPPLPPPDTAPPRVVAFVRARVRVRTGRRLTIQDTFRLTFGEAVDPSGAGGLGTYRLVTAGRDRRFGTRDDKVVRLASATFDPATNRVTVVARKLLPPGQSYQFSAIDSAIVDLAGNALDGDGDGQPGGAFVARFGRPTRPGRA